MQVPVPAGTPRACSRGVRRVDGGARTSKERGWWEGKPEHPELMPGSSPALPALLPSLLP